MNTYSKFACIHCGQHLECETGLAGRQIKCPNCQNRITVPSEFKEEPSTAEAKTDFPWDTVVPPPVVKHVDPRKL